MLSRSSNNYKRIGRLISIFLAISSFLWIGSDVHSDCSCTLGPYGSDINGKEYVQKSCPDPSDDDLTVRTYDVYYISCIGGVITKHPSYNPMIDLDLSPNFILSATGFNKLRSENGNHIFTVHDSFTGSLNASIKLKDDLGEYCAGDAGLSDTDQDGYPDCLDCLPNDNDNYGSCIKNENNFGPCPEPPQSGINTSL